jgi:hypothetical protein
MTDRVYKTAQGKTIDIGALILKNEKIRAVGNMGVNARGDAIDDANRVIDSKSRQVQRQVNKTVSAMRPGVDNTPVPVPQAVVKPDEPVAQLDPEEAADLAALEAEFETPELKADTEANSGMASAMARAKKKDIK